MAQAKKTTTTRQKSFKQRLATLRSEVGGLVKDTEGYNYKYFDINQMLEKIDPLLKEHNLLLTQPIVDNCVVTEIEDINGEESALSSLRLPEGVKPQDLGSAITYYRRYTLQSLLALRAEDDDAKSSNYTTPQATGGSGFDF